MSTTDPNSPSPIEILDYLSKQDYVAFPARITKIALAHSNQLVTIEFVTHSGEKGAMLISPAQILEVISILAEIAKQVGYIPSTMEVNNNICPECENQLIDDLLFESSESVKH
jgi:hypothetical protein